MNLKNLIQVDCSANPYDPTPVAAAVFDKIVALRQQDDRPIFVFSGELHAHPATVLLPFAFLLHAGLLTSTAPVALQTGLRFSGEIAHSLMTDYLRDVLDIKLTEDEAERLREADPAGERLLDVLQSTCYPQSLHARHYLWRALHYARVPVLATDLTSRQGKDGAYYCNEDDPLTKSLLSEIERGAEPLIRVDRPLGMAYRNIYTQYRLKTASTEAGVVMWHQGGVAHMLGDTALGLAFKASLGGHFNTMVKKGKAHVLVVVPMESSHFTPERIPEAAADFAGSVIAVDGLCHQNPPRSHDEFVLSSRIISSVFAAHGARPEAQQRLRPIEDIYWASRALLTYKKLYPHVQAAQAAVPA